MNKEICKGCKRFLEKIDDTRWFCAKDIALVHSYVIHDYVYYEGKNYHTITEKRQFPPEWCEYILEQTIAVPEDKVIVSIYQPKAFPRKNLV